MFLICQDWKWIHFLYTPDIPAYFFPCDLVLLDLTWYFTYFVTGVLRRGQLGLVDLIFQYIHCDEVYEAVSVLSSMNWDTLGQQCFISMSTIVNHLLRQRLTPEREGKTSVHCIRRFQYT